jgi:hypothetical protein
LQNLVWIYDAGLLFDSSFSWGYIQKKIFYCAGTQYTLISNALLGTLLTYWLLDAMYRAHDAQGLYASIKALHNQLKPNAQAARPASLRIEGMSDLLRQPFFGPSPVAGKVGQPAWGDNFATLDVQNFENKDNNSRPYMKGALVTV